MKRPTIYEALKVMHVNSALLRDAAAAVERWEVAEAFAREGYAAHYRGEADRARDVAQTLLSVVKSELNR
jgi:hypothetical protein